MLLHLVSSLPPDVVEDLADVVTSPDPTHPFDMLTAALISCKSESEHSRLQLLLTAKELGDNRPSQLLRHMPQNMVPVLAAASDVPLDKLAEMADQVADYSRAPSLRALRLSLRLLPQPLRSRTWIAVWTPLSDVSMTSCPSNARLPPGSGPAVTTRRLPVLSSFNYPMHSRRDSSSSAVCWYHRVFGTSAHR
nr:uncharacterized protein LOC126523376 [Dermacentor andersoni]